MDRFMFQMIVFSSAWWIHHCSTVKVETVAEVV